MAGRWMKRAMLVAAMGGILLLMSAAPGLAKPKPPSDHASRTKALGTDGAIDTQAAPSVSITAPSAAVGDFGASQGNVWDMDSTSDIVWTQTNKSGQTIQLGQPLPGIVRGDVPEGSDLAVAFYTSSSTNLPSDQYHHLIYRLKIAAEGNCRTNGRVIYAKAWPDWLGSQVFTRGFVPHSAPMSCPYGDYCIYYTDLNSNSNDIVGPDTATWSADPPPWSSDDVKAFGMWAHERWANCSGGPDYFDLDFVYLTGDIVAREKDGYTYTAEWQVSDPDGGTIISTIRYMQSDELQLPSSSPTCNSANFGDPIEPPPPPPSYPNKVFLPLLITNPSGLSGVWRDFDPPAEITSSPGLQTYDLDFSDDSAFEDGKSYYLCIRADDGTSQSYTASSAPVIRVPHSPNFGNE